MSSKTGNTKTFITIVFLAVLVTVALLLWSTKNSVYFPLQSTEQSIDLNQEAQKLDSADKDLDSINSSLERLNTDSNTF